MGVKKKLAANPQGQVTTMSHALAWAALLTEDLQRDFDPKFRNRPRRVFVEVGGHLFNPQSMRLDEEGNVIVSCDESE